MLILLACDCAPHQVRALPTSVPAPPVEFKFRLGNTHRIEQLKVNEH
jgi:hypothetical protein